MIYVTPSPVSSLQLDQSSKGVFECQQSPAVSSFMALLDVSEVTNSQKDAAHLLVSAMDSKDGHTLHTDLTESTAHDE